MIINFLDTSAILNGALTAYKKDACISSISLMQLQNIKTSAFKDNQIKYQARQAVREIIDNNDFFFPSFSQRQIEKTLKKYNFLSNINDHYIICQATLMAKNSAYQVNFITCDGAQHLLAKRIPSLNSIYYDKVLLNNYENNQYCGWGKYYPNEKQLQALYADPKMNILNCKTNEYAQIYYQNKLQDILRWSGKEYEPLKYKDIKSRFLNETIKPLNLQQKMAFDLLQNNQIPVKLLPGAVGTGKDYLMLTHALDLVQRGTMNKIIFVRNLVPFKDAPQIGYLAGNLQEKIAWGMGPLASILGAAGLQEMQAQDMIEAVNLGFIRGMSWDKTIIYVSQGQNITGGGYKLLVSRCGEGSQLWVNGDILQTDAKRFQENNGIDRLIKSLSGDPLFGMVKLIKTERSKTAELASKI